METMMQIVRRLLRESSLTESDMAQAVGTSPQNVHNKLSARSRSDIKASAACGMLAALGYKVVVMPIGKRTPDGCFDVGAGDEV